MRHLSRHKETLLALAVLTLAVSLFYARGLAPGQTFVPVDLANAILPWREGPPRTVQNWLISDPLYQFYPFLANSVNTLQRTGHWPLWNPNILLGHPVIADPLMQPFYPVLLVLGLLFGAARGLALGLWLHALLAAFLTFGLLRTMGCQVRAAVLGALTYALSGYLVTWFETPFWVSTLAWLPGILWAYQLALQRRHPGYVALAGLATGLAMLGGQFMFMVTFGLFWGLYALGRSAESARRGRAAAAWPLLALTGAATIGGLIGAIQVLPFAEYLPLTRRVIPGQGLWDALPWRQLITMVVPNFYGNPATVGPYWGEMNYSEGTIYAGLVALLLAGTAPFVARRRFVVYLALLALATVYFAAGGPGVSLLGGVPLVKYASLHRSTFLLPLLVAILAASALTGPGPRGRIVAVVALAVALATGAALYWNWGGAQSHWAQLRQPLLVAAALLALGVTLLSWRASSPAATVALDWALVALVFVDLYAFGSRYNPAGPIDKLLPSPPAIQRLQTLFPAGSGAGLQRAIAYQRNDEVLFGPNVLSVYGLADAGGYSSLVSQRYHDVLAAGDPQLGVWWMNRANNMEVFSRPSPRLLDLLGVTWVVSAEPLPEPDVRAAVSGGACAGATGEIAAGSGITGTFMVRDTAINRLDLPFRVLRPAKGGGQAGEVLAVRLWRGTAGGQQVLDARLEAAAVADGQTVALYFSPERQAPGQTYTWEAGAAGPGSTGLALCTGADDRPAISVYGTDWNRIYQGEVEISERLATVPRAYVVYAAEGIADDARAVARLLDPGFDLRNSAITTDALPLPVAGNLPATAAEITTYQDARVDLKARALQPGLLVLADQYHPGWRVTVDGRPASVLRVNQFQRGVLLTAGEHQVIFEFAPVSLRAGAALSGLGLAMAAILFLLGRRTLV